MDNAQIADNTKQFLDELFQPESNLSRFRTKKERTRYETKLKNMRESFGTKNGVQKIIFIDDTKSTTKYDFDLKDSESERAFINTLKRIPEVGGTFHDTIKRYRFRITFRGYLQSSSLNIISRDDNGGLYYPVVVEMMETYKLNISNRDHSIPKALKLSYQSLSKKYDTPERVFKIFYKNLLSLKSSIQHK
jgi:hypothetical protein